MELEQVDYLESGKETETGDTIQATVSSSGIHMILQQMKKMEEQMRHDNQQNSSKLEEKLRQDIQQNSSNLQEMMNQNSSNLEEKLNQNSSNLEEKLNQNSSNLEEKLNQNSSNLEEKLNQNSSNLEEKLRQDIQQNSNKLEANMKQIAEKLQEKMQENSEKLKHLKEDIQKDIKQMETRFEEKIKNIHTEFQRDIEQNEEKVLQEVKQTIQGEIVPMKKRLEEIEKMPKEKDIKQMETRFEEQMKNLHTELQREVEQNEEKVIEEVKQTIQGEIVPMQKRLEEIEKRPTEKVQVQIHPGMFRTEMDIKFFGDKRIHPVIYMKQLKNRIQEIGEEVNFKKIIRSTLVGAAESWFNIVEEKCNTFEEFSDAFLKYFWGDLAQSKVRENLYTGRYDEKFGQGREEYAMKKLSVARYLEPSMADEDIIKYIARHFGEEIRDVIAIQGIKDPEKLLQYLKRIDDIKPTKRRHYIQYNRWENRNGEDEKYRQNKIRGNWKGSETRREGNLYSNYGKDGNRVNGNYDNNRKWEKKSSSDNGNNEIRHESRTYNNNNVQLGFKRNGKQNDKEIRNRESGSGFNQDMNKITTIADIESVPRGQDFL